MVSGRVTSPDDQFRMSAGEARLMRTAPNWLTGIRSCSLFMRCGTPWDRDAGGAPNGHLPATGIYAGDLSTFHAPRKNRLTPAGADANDGSREGRTCSRIP